MRGFLSIWFSIAQRFLNDAALCTAQRDVPNLDDNATQWFTRAADDAGTVSWFSTGQSVRE
jgi:hypothetical protein